MTNISRQLSISLKLPPKIVDWCHIHNFECTGECNYICSPHVKVALSINFETPENFSILLECFMELNISIRFYTLHDIKCCSILDDSYSDSGDPTIKAFCNVMLKFLKHDIDEDESFRDNEIRNKLTEKIINCKFIY